MFDRHEKLILALLFAVQFCLIVDFMVIMPQGPQLMRVLDISAQEFALLTSVYTFGAGAMSLLASFFIDRFDRKSALITSFLGFAVCNGLCALSTSYEGLLLARALTGASAGVVGALIYSIVSDSIDIDRRASAVGLIMAAFALASILGVPCCLFLANRFGWSTPYILLAGLTLAICALVFSYLPRMTLHLNGRRVSWLETVKEFKTLAGERNRTLSLIFMSFLILGHFTINPFLFPSVVANAQIKESQLPAVYLVGGFASILASLFFGKLSDKFGHQRVFEIALVSSFAPIYLATHLYPMGLWGVAGVIASFFVFMGGRLTPATALVTATSSRRNRGSFMSLIGSVQQLSAALATYLAGSIVVKASDGKLLHFASVGFLAIAFSILALGISRLIVPLERLSEKP